ncbi:hypothetical protein [Saccharospirillum salsuginis]|nr:hypothetical protein [Saccharospirillum salsuginis]
MANKLRGGQTVEQLMNRYHERLVSMQCLTSNWMLEAPVFEITGVSYRAPENSSGVRMADLIEQESAGTLDMESQFKVYVKGRVYDRSGNLVFEEQLLDPLSEPIWQAYEVRD